MRPDVLLELDRLSRRYNRAPHEWLTMEPWQVAVAIACVGQADATTAQMVKDADLVVPVMVIGSV